MNNYLRDYRVKKLMTQKELAKASGISQVQISFIENDLSDPMELTKQKLALALQMPVEEIFPSKTGMHTLRYWRVKKLMTQKELAKDSGISQVTICFIETGITNPTWDTKKKLAKALKVSAEKLFPIT